LVLSYIMFRFFYHKANIYLKLPLPPTSRTRFPCHSLLGENNDICQTYHHSCLTNRLELNATFLNRLILNLILRTISLKLGILIIRIGSNLLEPIKDGFVPFGEHRLAVIRLSQAKCWTAMTRDQTTAIRSSDEGARRLRRCKVYSSALQKLT